MVLEGAKIGFVCGEHRAWKFLKLQSGRDDGHPPPTQGSISWSAGPSRPQKQQENASILEPIQNPSRPQTPGVAFGDHEQPGAGGRLQPFSPNRLLASGMSRACVAYDRIRGKQPKQLSTAPKSGWSPAHGTALDLQDMTLQSSRGAIWARIKLITWCSRNRARRLLGQEAGEKISRLAAAGERQEAHLANVFASR